MRQGFQPFEAPIKAIQELLGCAYERECPGLSDLCGVIQARRPKKIVKVGGAGSSSTAAVVSCVDVLHLPCQMYVVDAQQENGVYVREALHLTDTLAQEAMENCRLFPGCTLAACLDEIGNGIDLLVLDITETVPGNLLDFLAAFPYLASDAAVVVCSTFSRRLPGNVLFENVTADKISAYLKPCPDIGDCIQFAALDGISLFQINAGTKRGLADLFAALRCPWTYIPGLYHLLEYEASMQSHYDAMYLDLYREAVLEADPYKKMLKSVLESLRETFPQILLYGKGNRGTYFRKLARLLGVPVTGFVVSDRRAYKKTHEGLPVYPCSQIPFSKETVFVIQTVDSLEIEQYLRNSGFHWMNFPKSFWLDCDYHRR